MPGQFNKKKLYIPRRNYYFPHRIIYYLSGRLRVRLYIDLINDGQFLISTFHFPDGVLSASPRVFGLSDEDDLRKVAPLCPRSMQIMDSV